MSKSEALQGVRSYFTSGQFEKDLARRVALRTVSLGESRDAELLEYVDKEIQPLLEGMGFACRQVANPVDGGAPFLLAERIEAPELLTVLSYGHGDVVPAEASQWSEGLDPWDMRVRDGAWYGRGVADNKGQHSINLAALAEVLKARNGRLGFNVKLIFELGEERSSPGLRQLCREQAEVLKADVFIASDGPRVSLTQPTVFLGSRGSVIFELTCELRAGALHSGNWGGIMKNPATILSAAISSMVNGQGQVLVKRLLPEGIPAPVDEALSRLDVSSESLGRQIDLDWGEPGFSAAQKLLGWNTLEVLTLDAGNPSKPANAIPPSARAHLQLRCVVGTDYKNVEAIVREHLDAAGYPGVRVQVLRTSPPTRLDPDDPWVSWAKTTISAAVQTDVAIVPNLGGTVPNDAFSDILGLPTLWIPHSYPGCKQHAADEHLPMSIAQEGLDIMAAVFWELGAVGTELRR